MILSVFIINYNTGTLLKRCLQSLLAITTGHEIEIFIGDNNSTDDSISIAQEIASSKVSIVIKKYNYNAGFVKAINPLLKMAQGDYFLILHPDTIVSPKTFDEFLHFFNTHQRAGILGANLMYPDGSNNPCEIYCPGLKQYIFKLLDSIFRSIAFIRLRLSEWDHREDKQVECVWNACMIFRRQVFEDIGFFDDNYFVWIADQDFCKRARIAGWQCYYLRSPHVIHFERQSSILRDFSLTQDTLYKIDGWQGMIGIIKDRYRFIYKYHKSRSLINAIKTLDIMHQLFTIKTIVRRGNSLNRKMQIRIWRNCMREIITCIISIGPG